MNSKPTNPPNPNHRAETLAKGETQAFECEVLPADHPEIQARERERQQKLYNGESAEKKSAQD